MCVLLYHNILRPWPPLCTDTQMFTLKIQPWLKAVPLLAIIRYTLFDNNIIIRTNFINFPKVKYRIFMAPKLSKKNGLRCRWLLHFVVHWLSSRVTNNVKYKYNIVGPRSCMHTRGLTLKQRWGWCTMSTQYTDCVILYVDKHCASGVIVIVQFDISELSKKLNKIMSVSATYAVIMTVHGVSSPPFIPNDGPAP